MKNLTLQNIARVCHGTYFGDEKWLEREITSVVTDSRRTEEGCLFVPFAGARADAHDFIEQVMQAGALATLSEKKLEGAAFPYILVESTRAAVRDLAAFYLAGLGIPVVGITGSVGKTSTKEAVASVLKEKYRTLKTQGNFNNDLGVPLTIFRLREEDEIAVIEMGINHFGEMSVLGNIVHPETMVITNIGTAHLEFLGDRDGVFRAKTEVFDYIRDNGHVVLNGDDDKLSAVQDVHGIQPVFFSLKPDGGKELAGPAVYADELQSLGLEGTMAVLHLTGMTIRVKIPVPGQHMVANALAAAAVGEIYGLNEEEIRRGIESFETISGRFRIDRTDRFRIIDDCYNANPASMKSSVDTLKEASGRRIAILGDMGELGEDEKKLHEEVGSHVAASGIDGAVFVGSLAKYMADAAGQPAGMEVGYEPNAEALLQNLDKYVRTGDTILVKASHFMKFEKIVEALKKGDSV